MPALTMRITPNLRFVERNRESSNERCAILSQKKIRVLQQAWQAVETGQIEWIDVPIEVLE